jgi:hypothetical protein
MVLEADVRRGVGTLVTMALYGGAGLFCYVAAPGGTRMQLVH